MPLQAKQMTGMVTHAHLSPGSKSEHEGVVLRTVQGDQFILRRAGGNAFRDDALEQLVGRTITGTGVIAGQTFIMDDWTVKNAK